MNLSKYFELREEITPKESLYISVFGLLFLTSLWQLICSLGFVSPSILPSPLAVLSAVQDLHTDDELVRNTAYSIKLNLLGYLEAVAIALPLGFIIGLFPFTREMCRKYLDSIRFVPLTAVTGLFIAWFGIYDNMKIQFLAFGIIVYLLPVVVQRITEVDDVYVQTVKTLSIKKWDVIKCVFMPAVFSKVFDDIRVLVAISWTYIIVAEMLNKTGGVGAMCFLAARQSRIDKVFGILLVIILVGILQDKLFMWLDKMLFPYKYSGEAKNGK